MIEDFIDGLDVKPATRPGELAEPILPQQTASPQKKQSATNKGFERNFKSVNGRNYEQLPSIVIA